MQRKISKRVKKRIVFGAKVSIGFSTWTQLKSPSKDVSLPLKKNPSHFQNFLRIRCERSEKLPCSLHLHHIRLRPRIGKRSHTAKMPQEAEYDLFPNQTALLGYANTFLAATYAYIGPCEVRALD